MTLKSSGATAVSEAAVVNAAPVIALSASMAVKPPWIVPAEVESHLVQGRATTAGEVVDRRPWQLVIDQRPHQFQAAAALELLLREDLTLDLLAKGVVRRRARRIVFVGRRVEVGWLGNRIDRREDAAPGRPVRDQLVL